MLHAHDVATVRAAEAALMATLPPGTLMQRAAAGLAVAVAAILKGALGSVSGRRIVVLVGSGDNGGDALFAGAALARRGVGVTALTLDSARVHDAGAAALRRAGGVVVPLLPLQSDGSPRAAVQDLLTTADLVLDGIVGIGAVAGLRAPATVMLPLIERRRRRGVPVVAVDLPSGVEPDSGRTPGLVLRATHTVTFGTTKVAAWVDPAAAVGGELHVVDIGLQPWLGQPALSVLTDAEVGALLPRPGRSSDKYSRGVLQVRAGSAAFPGAAVLCVGGALAGGVGMVRFDGAPEVRDVVLRRWPEMVPGTGRVQARLVGPGIGDDVDGRSAATEALRQATELPVLLDADGLKVFDGAGSALPQGARALFTPHAGELAALLGLPRTEVEDQRLNCVREAARQFGATVLLKGATTLLAAPNGDTRAVPAGPASLATAGSGDVLAGLAGALLAAGLAPLDAGAVAATVHGRAGRIAAAQAAYPTAQDVLAALPQALLQFPRPPTLEESCS